MKCLGENITTFAVQTLIATDDENAVCFTNSSSFAVSFFLQA